MEMVKMESERNRGTQGWMDGQEFKTDISRDKRVKKTVSLLIQPSVLLHQRCVWETATAVSCFSEVPVRCSTDIGVVTNSSIDVIYI